MLIVFENPASNDSDDSATYVDISDNVREQKLDEIYGKIEMTEARSCYSHSKA